MYRQTDRREKPLERECQIKCDKFTERNRDIHAERDSKTEKERVIHHCKCTDYGNKSERTVKERRQETERERDQE